ncbi:MAG: ABC transporter ATP-binding protein [Thermodesulfobacteriota bacterium]
MKSHSHPENTPRNQQPILELLGVDTFYGNIQALYDINLEVRNGELVCLLGGNASGKSTTLKTILGVCRPKRGEVRLRGEPIHNMATKHIIARGVAIVPENRRIFPRLSVLENLEMGAFLRKDKDGIQRDIDRMLELFPALKARLQNPGITLSGGEQQMLAMARALISNPRMLLMDEPSMGLAPLLVDQQFDLIQDVNSRGTAVLVVEQNASMALSIAHRGYVLQTGSIVLADTAENLLGNEMMQRAYLGGDVA